MNSTLVTVIVSACLLAGIYLGTLLRRFLPRDHLSGDSRDAVKLAMGLVATMSALLLGLLVSSTKGSYDTTRAQVMQLATKVTLLDRVLKLYGPEAEPVRAQFREVVARIVQDIWPEGDDLAAKLAHETQGGDAVYLAIQGLTPRSDAQRSLKAQAESIAVDIAQVRTSMLAQSVPSISMPLLVVVVSWLVLLFLSFSLMSPPNWTATFAVIVSALSVSGAIFLILELDRPLSGLMRISSGPMLNALDHLAK